MSDSQVLRALQRGVTAAVAASDMPSLPVKYIETDFSAPDDGKWLELIFIPNNSNDFRGDEVNFRGILRLVLHWPNNGGGPYSPIETIESIVEYFPNGRVLSGVQISAKPTLTNIIPQGDETLYPVSLRYQSYRR